MRTFSFKALFITQPRFVGETATGGDAGAGGGGQTTTTAPATGGGGQTTTTAAPVQQTTSPATGGSQQQAASPSFRDRLGQLGIDTSRFTDDESAFAGLGQHLESVRAQEQFARLGQQAYPQWTEFQKWQAQQKQVADAEAAKKNQWWNPPEWDDRWLEGVERDPQTGELRPKQGFDPVLPSKIQQYRAFQKQMLDNLTKNPIEALKGGLEPFVQQIATQLIQQHLAGFSQQNQVQQIIQSNPWMYEKTEGGGVKIGNNGAPVLSLAGQIMQRNSAEIEAEFRRFGQTPNPQWVFQKASELTRGTLMQMQADSVRGNGQQTKQQAQQVVQQQTNNGAGGTNRLQGLSDAGNGSAGVPRQARKPLGQQMLAALASNGINELN